MTHRAGRFPALVSFASPVSHPPRRRHSSRIAGPPARWIAPSTPPPPSSEAFAAFTTASTRSAVMSPTTSSMRLTASPSDDRVGGGPGRPRGDGPEQRAQARERTEVQARVAGPVEDRRDRAVGDREAPEDDRPLPHQAVEELELRADLLGHARRALRIARAGVEAARRRVAERDALVAEERRAQ